MRNVHNAFFFVFLALFFVLPLGVLALYAVGPGWTYPELFPGDPDDRGLRFIMDHRMEIIDGLGSSLVFSLATAVATFVLCLAPAKTFAREEFPGKALLEGVFLAPALAPAMTFSMGLHYLFIRIGITDTVFGVTLALTIFTYPYMLRALTAGYLAFGPQYDAAAANLGAGPLTRLVKVELPLLLPSALAGGTVVFLIAFSEYFLVFLIGGGSVDSFTGMLFPFLNSSDRSVASLLTLIFLAVPIILFIIIETTVNRMYRRRGL